ncbi:set domain protein [Culex quinquefasciatus]|uniref:Set domain protein n=1 Tax=Culex quinquefasciatus TaxID=7176 RepID=B0XA82_CULQU|nr:set domain protein [Culex quinquefasciatus]|eukprot:XP_001866554.1 set domain protein [Culex quinquefasciatus]
MDPPLEQDPQGKWKCKCLRAVAGVRKCPTLFGLTTLDSSKVPVVPSFVQIETHGGEDIDPNLDDTF